MSGYDLIFSPFPIANKQYIISEPL